MVGHREEPDDIEVAVKGGVKRSQPVSLMDQNLILKILKCIGKYDR